MSLLTMQYRQFYMRFMPVVFRKTNAPFIYSILFCAEPNYLFSSHNQKTSNHMTGGYHSNRISNVTSAVMKGRGSQTTSAGPVHPSLLMTLAVALKQSRPFTLWMSTIIPPPKPRFPELYISLCCSILGLIVASSGVGNMSSSLKCIS